MNNVQENRAQYTQSAMIGMLAVLSVQGFHVFEHVLQMFQRKVLHVDDGAGLLGRYLDLEPVHFGYNAAFTTLVVLVFIQGEYVAKRKAFPLAFALMTLLVAFQGWHMLEHVVRFVHYLDTGQSNGNGILGNLFGFGWLHLFYNGFGYVVFVLAFFAGQAHREIGVILIGVILNRSRRTLPA